MSKPSPLAARKLAFVTVGATAAFDPLVAAVTSQSFLKALAQLHYTDLLIQYGLGGPKILDAAIPAAESGFRSAHGIRVSGFDFNKKGLHMEMQMTVGTTRGFNRVGVVISHAGMSRTANPAG